MIRSKQAGKRQCGGFSFNIFTDEEIYDIHLATLEVLEKTGVLVDDPEALEIFHGGGATIDMENKIVRIPPCLVEDGVRSCPPKLILYGRRPNNDVVLENNRIAFSNFGGAINLVDPYTGEIRRTTKADLAASALLVDNLEDLVLFKSAVLACDVPQEVFRLHHAEAMLSNTTKPIYMDGGNVDQTRKIIEMAAAVVGGKDRLKEHPILIFSACPVSPLKLIENACEIIMECARSRTPVSITSMALAGATAPVTLAGALIVHNAEVLAAIVLHQLTSKGAPIMYGSVTTAMDLRFSIARLGGPEISMISAAVAQLARYYQLPSNVAGGSDSKVSDAQAAHEITLTALLPALAGANIISGPGILEMGLTCNFGQLVMDCEFIRIIQHVVGGILVNDETMAVDVIHEVGPLKDFLGHDHTLKHMRTSQIHSELIDRRIREAWEKGGGKDIYQRAQEKARHILETHKPEPLPAGVLETLHSIIEEAEKELVVSKRGGRRQKRRGLPLT
jgi:trimethylamine--corrinoid protein Co-methyltransferase